MAWVDPVSVSLSDDLRLFSVPPPSSGIILAYILNILKFYELDQNPVEIPLLYHRITEAFKWAYASRSKLGDPSDLSIANFIDEVTIKSRFIAEYVKPVSIYVSLLRFNQLPALQTFYEICVTGLHFLTNLPVPAGGQPDD